MRDHSEAIRAFFEAYAKRFDEALGGSPKIDAKGLIDDFAGYFVSSDPKTVRGGKNGLLFRLMIPWGYRRYRKLGCKKMMLRGVEITGLDDFHAMARTHWSSLFRRKDKSVVEVEFDNIYLLHIPAGGQPRIFAYVTPDEQQVLRDHGIC